jgi:hypothetical protein
MNIRIQYHRRTPLFYSNPRLDTTGLVSRSLGGTKPDTTTIIIIAVCSSAGTIILIFILVKIFRACRPARVPLPPIQPLGHHKDKPATAFSWSPIIPERSSSEEVHRGIHGLAEASSSSSSSWEPRVYEDLTYAPNSVNQSNYSVSDPDPSLSREQDSFGSSQGCADSPQGVAGSDEELGISPEHMPTRSVPPLRGNHSRLNLTTRQMSVAMRSHQSRPLSMVSSASARHTSLHGLPCRNTIHGVPHGPHSNIRIVLPTPLASHARSYNGGVNREDLSARNSFVDQWALASRRSSLRSDYERATCKQTIHLTPHPPSSLSIHSTSITIFARSDPLRREYIYSINAFPNF